MPTKSGSAPSPSAAPASQAALDDTIAVNRTVDVVAANTVPGPAAGFRPTDAETRKRQLRRIAETLVSEAMDAGREANENAHRMKDDLGKHAPDGRHAGALVARLEQIQSGRRRAETLVGYYQEIEEIALSDLEVFLVAENREFEHAVSHEPQLADVYPLLVKYFAAKAAAISEGKRSARQTAATIEEKVAKATANAGGEPDTKDPKK
ncbi:MAG TPA: hypothetical protein VKW77_02355 [Acidimicrobiales bacterium]|nr:hypothetical protein [Acidimicrobiales bacterium]